MTIKAYHKTNYSAYKNIYTLRSVESEHIMRTLINKAESPNSPLLAMPSVRSAFLWFYVEFGLTISLLIAFIYRLFCM